MKETERLAMAEALLLQAEDLLAGAEDGEFVQMASALAGLRKELQDGAALWRAIEQHEVEEHGA